MRAMQLLAPGGLDHLKLVDMAEPGDPAPARSRSACTQRR